MNEHKVCFIYCANDEIQLQESLKYLTCLEIPSGFEIEVVAVRDAKSMTAGYNYAMKQTDAKYKVYLHQDTYIINKNFIPNIVDIFRENQRLGMLGMAGAARIPLSGVWWNSEEKYGKVLESHTGKMELLEFQHVDTDYQSVSAIDGFLIITQYDIPWREDVIRGWHFYDLSQSVEFMKTGYEVGVPWQDKPWSLHDCGVVNVKNGFEESKRTFLQEYSEFLYPKVSVMIPTYNRPYYFELALRSVLEQTYKHIEVIICDDSTNDETKELIQTYLEQYPNIRYFKNERNLGQFLNDLKCMELATGEYVNFLMDDDLFHPQKIEKMMAYFLSDVGSEISLVTSHRQLIDDTGASLKDLLVTKRLFDQDTIIDGYDMGNHMLAIPANLIGEPSTVLFRRADLDEPFGSFSGREYICNVDMASWLNLLSKGKIVYISETLSYFRMHSGQQQQSIKMSIGGMIDFAHQIINTPLKGFYKDQSLYATAIKNCLKYIYHLDENLNLHESDRATPEYQQTRMYYDLLQQKLAEVEASQSITIHEHPLVSVLIPAYNRPHYLELALQSVLNQTYKNIEIIICDDSTNDEVQNMIQPYLNQYNNIQYYRNEKQLNFYNLQKLYHLAKGTLISYLCDDDMISEKKFEKMVPYFINHKDVSLVTSYRKLIGQNGNGLEDTEVNRAVFNQDTILDGKTLGDYILRRNINVIGEPSTAMFRKADLHEEFGVYQGFEYNKCIVDLATWISLLSKGKAVYITEPLSFFRQHSGQNQKSMSTIIPNINEWLQLIIDSRRDGFLNKEVNYKSSLTNFLKSSLKIIEEAISSCDTELLLKNNVNECLNYAFKELANRSDEFQCPYCNTRFKNFLPWPDIYDFPKYKFEMNNKKTAICPECYAMDRERLYRLYIEKETNLLDSQNKVLHVAPEKNMRDWLVSYKNLEYMCTDLFPQDSLTQKMDITSIELPDNSFDVIFCSHVLEHIPEDRKAMMELYRVLKKGGWAILQVPIAVSIDETYEDFSITSPEERLRAFGQDDHVRIYAKDYIDRLESVGFDVKIYNFASKYGIKEAAKYGLSENDNLYVAFKS